MIFSDQTQADLIQWAEKNKAIAALWLFGSRARGDHRPESDYDFAVELMSKDGSHDWSFGDFLFEHDEWKEILRVIVQAEVSLVCYRDDLECKFDPRIQLIWQRVQSTS